MRRYILMKMLNDETKEEPVKEEWKSRALPNDWEFMKESADVLESIPDTWKQYPANAAGMASIIDMEYNEMKRATAPADKMHELVHLASAALYLWRELRGK